MDKNHPDLAHFQLTRQPWFAAVPEMLSQLHDKQGRKAMKRFLIHNKFKPHISL